MDDLSPAFAAESLTVNIIEELRERLESTDDYTKQLGLITEMEEKYQLEEGILLSHKQARSKPLVLSRLQITDHRSIVVSQITLAWVSPI
jgi:uncharacterized Zn finger protein